MNPQYVFFILITLVYFFVIKKEPTVENLSDYSNLNNILLVSFVLIVILSQAALNTLDLTRRCNGTYLKNMKKGFGLTFIPWIFVFVTTVLVIHFFPKLKSMFSNVMGYLFLYGMTYDFFNKVIGNNITIKPDILNNISSVLNEMTTQSFTTVVEKMLPIMTERKEGDMQELLSIVSLKENIGEMFWYLLAGILSILISFYSLEKKGCVEDIQYIRELQERIKNREKDELQKEQEKKEQEEKEKEQEKQEEEDQEEEDQEEEDQEDSQESPVTSFTSFTSFAPLS